MRLEIVIVVGQVGDYYTRVSKLLLDNGGDSSSFFVGFYLDFIDVSLLLSSSSSKSFAKEML